MNFLLGTIAKEIPGPELNVHCLWCGKDAHAQSRRRTEWLMLFHIVPLFPLRTVFVRCGACQQEMLAKCSLEELDQINPLTSKYHLAKRVSFIGRSCILLGLLFCWAPLVGLLPAIVGFFCGRKYGGRMQKWGSIGLILNLLSPLIFLLLIVIIRAVTK